MRFALLFLLAVAVGCGKCGCDPEPDPKAEVTDYIELIETPPGEHSIVKARTRSPEL